MIEAYAFLARQRMSGIRAAVFRAHDKQTGKTLAEIKLLACQGGQPITYMVNGKQYIAMFVGDGKSAGETVALALPDAKSTKSEAKKSEE